MSTTETVCQRHATMLSNIGIKVICHGYTTQRTHGRAENQKENEGTCLFLCMRLAKFNAIAAVNNIL